MNSVKSQKFTATINWKITLASGVFLPLLIGLGFWQLNRAQEKQILLDNWYIQQALPAITINNLDEIENGNLETISLEGEFDAKHYWLVENRFYKGKLGYEVLMPFQIRSDEQIIVNRGWVPASPYREILPEFETPANKLRLYGAIRDPEDFNVIKEKNLATDSWPQRILEIDLKRMSQTYGATLHSKILRLDQQSAGALNIDWPVVNVTPAKHKAYAFQWFAMAFALLILWFCANTNILQLIKAREKKQKL